MNRSEFVMRRAVAADAPALWAIRADAIRQTCSSHYAAGMLEQWAASPIPEVFPANIEKEYFLVGIAETRIVGFAALKLSSAQIDAVFVSPDHGRRGLGRQMLAHLDEVACRAGLPMLWVRASLNAVPFYCAAGYRMLSEGVYTTSMGVEIACVRMEKRLDCARPC